MLVGSGARTKQIQKTECNPDDIRNCSPLPISNESIDADNLSVVPQHRKRLVKQESHNELLLAPRDSRKFLEGRQSLPRAEPGEEGESGTFAACNRNRSTNMIRRTFQLKCDTHSSRRGIEAPWKANCEIVSREEAAKKRRSNPSSELRIHCHC